MRNTKDEAAEVLQAEASSENGRAWEAGTAHGNDARSGTSEGKGPRDHVLAVERAVERLRALGVRMTPQRYAILNYLYTHHEHPTAEEIYQALASEYPSMSVATVYNNLKVFKEAGLIQELTFGDQASRYDANPEDHYHVVCVVCGKVEDLPYTPYFEVEDEAARRLGYQVLDHKLVIYGICPDCQRKGLVPSRRKRGEEDL
ncbi:Fur family transcriptional regulator [Brockia lithotrophica]|uniref:Fe2+ or Zn2+ uptake regulation protein n=1 Tax=Brockia lithotrophica TaxID=933949 RepID=A0A660KX97_9BACL|nr:Fe2+ or Zn2+ uptake regulation protein [Brockia lithotrophica]